MRKLTTGLVAGATLLTAAFAGLAASSTHTAKRVVRTVVTTSPAKTVTAPTPTLTPSGSTATPSQTQTPSQSQTVTPSVSPPVVVGGGS